MNNKPNLNRNHILSTKFSNYLQSLTIPGYNEWYSSV